MHPGQISCLGSFDPHLLIGAEAKADSMSEAD
jgi:hypothetical protein